MQICRQAHYNRLHRFGGAKARTRSGFTLIEVLIVIAIIGVLVGLLIPAVNMARRSVQQAAIAFEVQALANAIEQYKNKYGDYPPDGSNLGTFRRHFGKAFPSIADSEYTILLANSAANNGGAVMDPSEALVFCLGGFSNDPVHPFTGPGGPLVVAAGGVYQYNADRTNALYEFKPQQLSIEAREISGVLLTVSNDEQSLYGASAVNDLMPVYYPSGGRRAPFVYFDSRTYRTNSFAPAGFPDAGAVTPYKSEQRNTNSLSTPSDTYRFMNERSFQIVSAGLDDSYGGQVGFYYIFPTGESLGADGTVGAFSQYRNSPGLPSTQLDNATNFSEGILGNSLP